MVERDTFLKRLEADPTDETARLVYADWLDDRGEHDEAERQRTTVLAAVRWLAGFAAECGDHCPNYSEVFDARYGVYRETGSFPADDEEPAYDYRPVTIHEVIEAARLFVAARAADPDDVWAWDGFTQLGCETARNLMQAAETRKKYWECVTAVTGLRPPGPATTAAGDTIGTDNPFSCSC